MPGFDVLGAISVSAKSSDLKSGFERSFKYLDDSPNSSAHHGTPISTLSHCIQRFILRHLEQRFNTHHTGGIQELSSVYCRPACSSS